MIADEESTLHTNQKYFQGRNVLDSETLMSQSSKHFILSNLEGISNSEENSIPDSMGDKSSNAEESEISSLNVEDHSPVSEDNYMSQTNAGSLTKHENVLPPSAF